MSDNAAKNAQLKRLTGIALFLVVVALLLAVVMAPDYIQLLEIDANTALKIVGSLFLVTAFVERAVQVILGIWVEPGKVELKSRIKAAKVKQAIGADGTGQAAQDEITSTEALSKYRGATGRLAFTIALLMGIVVSWIGVRSLRTLIDPTSFDEVESDFQRHAFTVVDVLVTGALIAGGSNGMHELMQTIIEFFNSLRVGMNPETRKP